MGSIYEPDHQFIPRIGFQNRGGRISMDIGTENIGRILMLLQSFPHGL